jgi:hypothetical protein
VINIFLGWTFIGWVSALVLASATKVYIDPPQINHIYQANGGSSRSPPWVDVDIAPTRVWPFSFWRPGRHRARRGTGRANSLARGDHCDSLCTTGPGPVRTCNGRLREHRITYVTGDTCDHLHLQTPRNDPR